MRALRLELLTLLGMPAPDHIRLAAELGCQSVSLGLQSMPLAKMGYPDLNLYPEWTLSDANCRRETEAAFRETGVAFSLCEGFVVGARVPPSFHEAGLDLPAQLGAQAINGVSMDPDRARTFDQLAELSDLAKQRGLKFSIEFVPETALATLDDALALSDHIGAAGCTLVIDAMHFFRSGASLDALKKLPPERIGASQMCDAPRTSSAPYRQEALVSRMVPGSSEFPLRDWLAALPPHLEIGLEVPMIARFQNGVSPRQHAAEVVAAARKLLS